MSLYWQQALQQNQAAAQNSSTNNAPQQGQWDYINLGGAPAQQYQWNQAGGAVSGGAVSQQYQRNQTGGNVSGGAVSQQHVPNNSSYDSFYYQQKNDVNQSYQQSTQNQSWNSQQPPQQNEYYQHQPQQIPTAPQKSIEHTPILTQPPAQPQHHQTTPTIIQASAPTEQFVNQPQIIQQNHANDYQQSINISTLKEKTPVAIASTDSQVSASVEKSSKNSSKNDEAQLPDNPPTMPNIGESTDEKVTPPSSEDDWEKADIEQLQTSDETPKINTDQQLTGDNLSKNNEESRESSLGGSWSQNDQDEPNNVTAQENVSSPNWNQEIEKKSTIGDAGKEIIIEKREETPDSKLTTMSREETLNLSTSPGEAQATSTPKDQKVVKRGSMSSQKSEKVSEAESDKKRKEPVASKIEEKNDQSGNNSDSTMASGHPEGFERGNIRASYRNYKQQYSEILKRLNGYRVDKTRTDFRPASKLSNPLLVAAGITGHPALRSETMHNINSRNDGRTSVPLPKTQSFNDELYATGRRQRVSRLESGRPSSRTPGYPPSNQSFNEHQSDLRQMRHGGYPEQNRGRYSAIGVPYQEYPISVPGYDPRRPQSTFMMEHSSNYGHHNHPHHPHHSHQQNLHYHHNQQHQQPDGSSISESEEEEDDVDEDDAANGESDDELRRYNNIQNATHNPQYQPSSDGAELYYFGVVQISPETANRICERHPPPVEYYALPPIEKAAFMFYAAVYKQQYRNVDAFHKRFNREFFKYVCAGDTNDVALYKICKSMQDQYVARLQEKKLKTYDAKNLFSDDNSIDGKDNVEKPINQHEQLKSIMRRHSEITSIYENEGSVNGLNAYNKGPYKFTHPHAFMTFGVGGKTISVQPEQSVSVVEIEDVKSYLRDVPTLRVLNTAQTFKGPLIPNHSAPHTVRLYISKQIEAIKLSEVAQENPSDNDVVESLLVWQLLETMVKQQGNITGPDIAELIGKVASQPLNIEAAPQAPNVSPALNKFTEFLLGGHVDEAIEGAVRNGLFADALVLTRRLYPNDERKIAEIEERFLQTRSINNPVTTLVSVASGVPPPVLINPPFDDKLSWRTHAAIILANLDQNNTTMSTIYQLGQALARRDYQCAADFCFLVVCVLAGYDPFKPIQAAEGEEDARRHISLINSGIPDDDESVRCQYGFSITDLHATEIFDYAFRLKPDRAESPLSRSVEYQTARIKYAKLLASHGFTTDAYRYCVEIARSIWNHYQNFKKEDLLEMCDLAESLHYVASASPSETTWIEELRKLCASTPLISSSWSTTTLETSKNEVQQHEADHSSDSAQIANRAEESSVPNTMANYEKPSSNDVYLPQKEYHTSSTPSIIDQQTPEPPVSQNVNSLAEPSQLQQAFNEQREEAPKEVQAQHSVQHYAQQESQPNVISNVANINTLPPINTASSPNDVCEPVQANQEEGETNAGGDASSRGWLGNLRQRVTKAIPSPNQMVLPDDKKPAIVWDPIQNKYVGDGVEQEQTVPLPPTLPSASMVGESTSNAPPTSAQVGGGIRAKRGAARYAQVGLGSEPGKPSPSTNAPPMQLPTASFGFIPTQIDDGNDFDPFSGQANPSIQQHSNIPSDE